MKSGYPINKMTFENGMMTYNVSPDYTWNLEECNKITQLYIDTLTSLGVTCIEDVSDEYDWLVDEQTISIISNRENNQIFILKFKKEEPHKITIYPQTFNYIDGE